MLHFRPDWKGLNSPWRHLARLKPGQSWFELPEPDLQSQSQAYVLQPATPPIPPEAMAARELVAAGASEAFVIENWLGLGVMHHDLIGARRDHRIWELIAAYKATSGKPGGGGFPDVIAFWPDHNVSACEVKVRGKDRLNRNQIAAAGHLRALLGDRLELRIFEWPGPRTRAQPHPNGSNQPRTPDPGSVTTPTD